MFELRILPLDPLMRMATTLAYMEPKVYEKSNVLRDIVSESKHLHVTAQ